MMKSYSEQYQSQGFQPNPGMTEEQQNQMRRSQSSNPTINSGANYQPEYPGNSDVNSFAQPVPPSQMMMPSDRMSHGMMSQGTANFGPNMMQ